MLRFDHVDKLDILNKHIPLKEKLVYAHQLVQTKYAFIARIAITLYDPDTHVLKTFLHSSGDDHPLEHYQAVLDEAASLQEIIKIGRPRIINNLQDEKGHKEHSRRIRSQGYAASYTMPMYHLGEFFGFVFFNSYQKEVFAERILSDLDLYGHLLSLMVINEISSLRVMSAAVKTTNHITHLRDPETGSHLDRMSRYSRVIAEALAGEYDLDDDYIEHVFMFAPLHDIGKIAIPDKILLKPGGLSDDELKIMKTHAVKGREMIDDMVKNFGIEQIENIHVLRNIATYHHEAVNGTGYPEGKAYNDIPLEARIVAVADVFDALTTKRPYKEAWNNDDAFAMLEQLAGEKLDSDCVKALNQNRDKVEKIQQLFGENQYG